MSARPESPPAEEEGRPSATERESRDPVEDAVTIFTDLCRKGERPDTEDFARRFPGREDEVRELISALLVMEACSPEPPAQAADTPRLLGDYRLLREIGRGGMGIVYEAVQESLGRHVALKVLPINAVFGERRLERFRREARAVAALHHSNIVPVFGIGEEEGLHYYAMQFIQGQALDEVLKEVKHLRAEMDAGRPERSLPVPIYASESAAERLVLDDSGDRPPAAGARPDPERRAHVSSSSTLLTDSEGLTSRGSRESRYSRNVGRLGLQAAEALAYAHEQGVLHRDIKPSNLLLDTEDRLWLTDFGLAKSGSTVDLTHTGELVGTLSYMAPERFKGWCDVRSDIYSLGVTLYECLALRPAFGDDDRVRLMKRIAGEEPIRPRRVNPHVPRDLETIVLKCMEKEPERRYASAEDLVRDLRSFLADKPIESRPVSGPERAWRWCRRNAALSALLGASGLFLLIAAGTLLVARAAYEGKRAAEAAEQDARYWQSFSRAQASRASTAPGRKTAGLAAIEEASRQLAGLDLSAETLRSRRLQLGNEAIACHALDDLEPARVAPRYPEGATCAAFDASFERYATGEAGGVITVRSVNGDGVLGILRGRAGDAVNLRFSPDGSHLAAEHERDGTKELRLWDLVGERILLESGLATAAGRGPVPWEIFDFSPDGARLVLGRPGGRVLIHDLSAPDRSREITVSESGKAGCVRFDPGGRRIAVVSDPIGRDTGLVSILDTETGAAVSSVSFEAEVQALAWHPSGRYLAAACVDWRVHVADLTASGRPLPGEESQTLDFALAYSHSGDTLASVSLDSTLRLRDPFTGRERTRVLGSITGRSLIFSRDDKLLAQHGQGLQVWSSLGATNCRALQCPSEVRLGRRWGMELGAFSWSPRMGLVATSHDDGVRLWDLVWKEEAAHIELRDVRAALFHPAGDSLITVSDSGIHAWPVRQARDTDGESVRVGPPRALGLTVRNRLAGAALSADGRILVVSHEGHFHVREGETEWALSGHHWGNRWLELSPDGRWLATSGSTQTNIWCLKTGALVHSEPAAGRYSIAGFTPDGSLLVVTSDRRHRFIEVGSWMETRSMGKEKFGIHCPLAFSRDGTLSACPTASGEVCLLDPISGDEQATLARAGPATIVTSLAFSPDGGTLAASTTNNLLVLWDLRRVRDDLREFGLDWDGRALPPESSPAGTSRLRITVSNEPLPQPSAAEFEKELVRCAEMMAAGPPDAARSGR